MRKIGRKKNHRQMMLRNLVTSLILYERIKTTAAKAKECKRLTNKILSIALADNLTARRQLISYLLDKNAVKKIFVELLPNYDKKQSSFVKSYHLPSRLGDNSPMILLELIKAKKSTQLSKEQTEEKINVPKKEKRKKANR